MDFIPTSNGENYLRVSTSESNYFADYRGYYQDKCHHDEWNSHSCQKILYDGLLDLFGSFSSGSMVCSVGKIHAKTTVEMGITCSALRGSSGVAVLPLYMGGYFWGLFFGGGHRHDPNIATTTDSNKFVSLYMNNVLDTLPHPLSSFWQDRDLDAFLHWLGIHLKDIPRKSPWSRRLIRTYYRLNLEPR
ncbi:hypothetical protein GOP47_0026084 [Adiantum capillus-veneris]|uniref:Uncharacterized protein n=1 Tax=Adiantum capillus-veneris TaxID=13818 RepID=A0A9D4U1N3_ADICA|nr:hypothetical protein GOP47_0026084 [Adiantum capillus-veneris]